MIQTMKKKLVTKKYFCSKTNIIEVIAGPRFTAIILYNKQSTLVSYTFSLTISTTRIFIVITSNSRSYYYVRQNTSSDYAFMSNLIFLSSQLLEFNEAFSLNYAFYHHKRVVTTRLSILLVYSSSYYAFIFVCVDNFHMFGDIW